MSLTRITERQWVTLPPPPLTGSSGAVVVAKLKSGHHGTVRPR